MISEAYSYEADVDMTNKTNNLAVRSMVGGISSGLFKSQIIVILDIMKSVMQPPLNFPKLDFLVVSP